MQLYLIKSGPGCGKSTMMKQLAQLSAGPVQRIHCSSDPDSLDGVVFCDKNAAILDATAPHTLEPLAPGADEVVVSLYHTISTEAAAPLPGAGAGPLCPKTPPCAAAPPATSPRQGACCWTAAGRSLQHRL